MIRIGISVEGQTKEAFVNDVLEERLRDRQLTPTPVLIGRARGRGGRFPFSLRFPVSFHSAYTSGMAAAFDTLVASKELQAAGFDQTQAEAVVMIVLASQGNLATNDGIAALRTKPGALRSELDAFRSEQGAFQSELNAFRSELGVIKWLLGLVAALNIAILVRLLPI